MTKVGAALNCYRQLLWHREEGKLLQDRLALLLAELSNEETEEYRAAAELFERQFWKSYRDDE